MLNIKYKRLASAIIFGLSIILALSVAISSASASPASDYEEADAAATAAAEEYENALAAQEEAQVRLADTETKVSEQEQKLAEARQRSSQAVVALYKNSNDLGLIDALLGAQSLDDALTLFDGYMRVNEYRLAEATKAKEEKDTLDVLLAEAKAVKEDADAKVEEASSAQEAALEARDEAREAYEASQQSASYSSGGSTGVYAATSSSWNDEQSAKEYIIYRESRGDYSATNGRYYGAYQLDSSYLDGDFSPAHQDEVAEAYVQGRYGSWSAAADFWDSHNWY